MLRIFHVLLCLLMSFQAQVNPSKMGAKYIFPLTSENWELSTNKGQSEKWLILFHSPNCGHCVNFKPTYNKLAFDNKENPVKFGEVNCQEQKNLCKMMRIKAYPSLILLNDNKMYHFRGSRAEDRINSFIKEDWRATESNTIFTELPSFLDELIEGFKQFKIEITQVFSTEGNYIAKGVLAIFFVMVFSIIFLSFYFCYDCIRPQKYEKIDKKENKIKKE